MEPKLISLFGLVIFVALAWMISAHRRLFPWRTVLWGVGLQFIFALLILKTPWGANVFDFAGRAINRLIQFSNEGCQFVFGPLADNALLADKFGPAHGMVFAVLIVGTIIIVAVLSSLLYPWGILQTVVQAVAWVMRRTMVQPLA